MTPEKDAATDKTRHENEALLGAQMTVRLYHLQHGTVRTVNLTMKAPRVRDYGALMGFVMDPPSLIEAMCGLERGALFGQIDEEIHPDDFALLLSASKRVGRGFFASADTQMQMMGQMPAGVLRAALGSASAPTSHGSRGAAG
jgi:hypothetical protein